MKRLWYQNNLIEMLPYVTELLKKNNVKYWLDWGTLLGAVRDGRMIPWDFDIDLGIYSEDVAKALALRTEVWKDGYDLCVCPVLESKLYFYKKDDSGVDFHIDLDAWIKDGDILRSNFNQDIIHTAEELENLQELEFEGKMYPVPKEPEKVLARFFGQDWRRPKVTQGNIIYIKTYDPDNEAMLNEVKKYEVIQSAWDEAFSK